MYKISLLLILVSPSMQAMLGSVAQSAKYVSGAVRVAKCMQSPMPAHRMRMISGSSFGMWWLGGGYEVQSILEKEAYYDFNDQRLTEDLTQEERTNILKKIMIHINRGEEYDFYFRTGGVDNGSQWCYSGNDNSREMLFSDLVMEKDWTHGEFRDLSRYFKAVHFLRSEKADVSVKELSRAIIQDVMKTNGIDEQDVLPKPKSESTSSRLQDADE